MDHFSPGTEQVWEQQAGVTLLSVADVPDGEICRMAGTVGEYAGALRAPLSGRACVYYMVVAEQPGVIWTQCDGVAFGLEDASGRAIIEPASAKVALVLDHREHLKALRYATPQQDAILMRHGYDVRGSGGLVFYEAVITVGERITVSAPAAVSRVAPHARKLASAIRRRCGCASRVRTRPRCASRAIAQIDRYALADLAAVPGLRGGGLIDELLVRGPRTGARRHERGDGCPAAIASRNAWPSACRRRRRARCRRAWCR